MKKNIKKFGILLLVFFTGVLILSNVQVCHAQQIRWLSITQLQTPTNDAGAEWEGEFNPSVNGQYNNILSWPVQYSINQHTCRMRAFWIGARNFDDPVAGKVLNYKVIGVGTRSDNDRINVVFPQQIKLLGKISHPPVTVDNVPGSYLDNYDAVDAVDPSLEADRAVVVKFNTSIGISVTKKVMAFDQSNHDNYHVYDFIFKNTGIYNAAGAVKQQKLDSVWFYWANRYAFAGVSVSSFNNGWGAWSETWGNSNIVHSFGGDPTASDFNGMKGYYVWQGPDRDQALGSYADDWGNPAYTEDGTLASAKYAGIIVLHADKSTADTTNDPWQPRTNNFIGADYAVNQVPYSQYDQNFMSNRWAAIEDGHPAVQHDVLVSGIYPISLADPVRESGGGTQPEMAFGPYQMAYGDSIHIVFAEAVAGLSWDQCRTVGQNWYQYKNNTGANPPLVLPNNTTASDYNVYKKAWFDTCQDSIMQTYNNAIRNYNTGYKIAKAPPPPNNFTVNSGGDRIQLSWGNNADAAAHFDGYVVYRSMGSVLDRHSVYEKIFECSKANVVHNYDDKSALRGRNYYYYVQSKDDGTQNDLRPGVPLYSSLFWTVTSVPATLQRPAVTAPPNAPAPDTINWRPTVDKGVWNSTTGYYYAYEKVTRNDTTYVCIHDSTRGRAVPDTSRYWKPLISKGTWVFGSAYRKYNAVMDNGVEFVCIHDIAAGSMLEQVRVVPNPYDIRARLYQFNAVASGPADDHDRIAFFQLPPICKLMVFTERGDKVWEKDHINGSGDELYNSETISGQMLASGIYILYVEVTEDVQAQTDIMRNGSILYHKGDITAHKGDHIIRKFVVIR